MFRCLTLLFVALLLGGCATTPDDVRPAGKEHCESFFIYVLCISDLDMDGQVDYMYFDDTRDIFLYAEDMLNQVTQVLPLHPCAIPMSENTRDLSSRLLYSEGLGISAKLALKGKMAVSYRAAQPAVDACAASIGPDPQRGIEDERPFDDKDDWPEGAS